MIGIIRENWELLAGIFTSIFAFFGGKKLKKAGEKKATSEALETMQKTYDTFVIDFRERYDELKEEQRHFRSELIFYKEQIVELQKNNRELTKELKDWEQKYTKLKNEFELYKKEK